MTTKPNSNTNAIMEDRDSVDEKSSLYSNRHSTIAASIFFPDSLHDEEGYVKVEVDSLPNRIHHLVQHYLQNPHLAMTEERSITLSADPMEARRIDLTASIVVHAPNHTWVEFKTLFQDIFSHYFDDSSEEEEEEEEESILDFDEQELYNCIEILQWLNPCNDAKTDILSRPFLQSLHETIRKHTSRVIKGEYEEEHLYDQLQAWVQEELLPIIAKIILPSLSSSSTSTNTNTNTNTSKASIILKKYEAQIHYILADCYCIIRQNEIFDIVTEYPDSLPAIIDLNHVLQKTHAMNDFIATLKDTFRERLLHPGAQTIQIIQIYIYTIKVLRIIDPTDCLLEHVSMGIKAYLRGRGDTVRCIISSLTDEDALGGDLYKELQRQDNVRPLEEAQYDSDDEEDMPGWDWNPTPSLYYQQTSGTIHRHDTDGGMEREMVNNEKAADLLSMLVGIYGSNDLFVDEYRLMLADKLLANIDFDTDREVHNLELLKIRFGESSMRQCEIMIKDMADSKRISANIHSTMRGRSMEEESNGVVDGAIISHIFWPPLQKETVKNHPRIQASIDQFSLEYAKYKNPRRLVWFDQLGQVELELDVYDNSEITTKSFTCAPIQATLISHFEDNDGSWTAEDLGNETGVSEDVIKKKMGFWINNHVVKVSRGTNGETKYALCSHHDVSTGINKDYTDDDDDDDGLIVSMSGQEEEELSTYESYVLNMLSNLGQLPLERIHNMLKMMATGSDHKYNMSPQQLSQFLQQLCRGERIEYGADGMYKLVKK